MIRNVHLCIDKEKIKVEGKDTEDEMWWYIDEAEEFNITPSFDDNSIVWIDLGWGKIEIDRETFLKAIENYYREYDRRTGIEAIRKIKKLGEKLLPSKRQEEFLLNLTTIEKLLERSDVDA